MSSEGEEDTTEGNVVVTTSEEIEAYHIVKSLVRIEVAPERVFMRDAKTYCSILLDDNNRNPIVRLHFNRRKTYLGLFEKKKEDRQPIERLDDIYAFAGRLQATAREYDRRGEAAE